MNVVPTIHKEADFSVCLCYIWSEMVRYEVDLKTRMDFGRNIVQTPVERLKLHPQLI